MHAGRRALSCAVLLACGHAVTGTSAFTSRRAFCGGLTAVTCGLALRPVAAAPPELLRDGNAVRCENGTGDACEAAAEGNELIKRLQEQSRANRDRNEQDVRARWTRNAGYDGACRAAPCVRARHRPRASARAPRAAPKLRARLTRPPRSLSCAEYFAVYGLKVVPKEGGGYALMAEGEYAQLQKQMSQSK